MKAISGAILHWYKHASTGLCPFARLKSHNTTGALVWFGRAFNYAVNNTVWPSGCWFSTTISSGISVFPWKIERIHMKTPSWQAGHAFNTISNSEKHPHFAKNHIFLSITVSRSKTLSDKELWIDSTTVSCQCNISLMLLWISTYNKMSLKGLKETFHRRLKLKSPQWKQDLVDWKFGSFYWKNFFC